MDGSHVLQPVRTACPAQTSFAREVDLYCFARVTEPRLDSGRHSRPSVVALARDAHLLPVTRGPRRRKIHVVGRVGPLVWRRCLFGGRTGFEIARCAAAQSTPDGGVRHVVHGVCRGLGARSDARRARVGAARTMARGYAARVVMGFCVRRAGALDSVRLFAQLRGLSK